MLLFARCSVMLISCDKAARYDSPSINHKAKWLTRNMCWGKVGTVKTPLRSALLRNLSWMRSTLFKLSGCITNHTTHLQSTVLILSEMDCNWIICLSLAYYILWFCCTKMISALPTSQRRFVDCEVICFLRLKLNMSYSSWHATLAKFWDNETTDTI